jgi:hypothetical protein
MLGAIPCNGVLANRHMIPSSMFSLPNWLWKHSAWILLLEGFGDLEQTSAGWPDIACVLCWVKWWCGAGIFAPWQIGSGSDAPWGGSKWSYCGRRLV